MILASLPQEVKSEMVTKKVTGSTPSLIFKLLTSYRPGGEKEKTLLLQQLTAPDAASNAEEAVQGLRRWGRWHARAKDLTVTVPDPVLMIKGLASIVSNVLGRHQDVWLRTSMVRQKLQLDSNPTEEATLNYHKHLQAEMELLSTATNGVNKGPKIRSAATAADPAASPAPSSSSTPAAKPKAQPGKEKPCRWFAKTDSGCRRGVDCQFAHDWGATSKTGRCLVCSSTSHVKKDCPVKEKGASAKLQKPKNEAQSTVGGPTPPSARALTSAQELPTSSPPQAQPAGEPSPAESSSPSSRGRVPPEEERPDDLKQVLADASKMLKTMMANSSAGASTSTAGAPTYESLQKQLDELRMKSLRVQGEESQGRHEASPSSSTGIPTYDEVLRQLEFMTLKVMKVDGLGATDQQGTLLDSGSTHILRPAKNEEEKRDSQSVYVTLAGDEQRLLSQAPSGSILVDATNTDTVQSIIPFGKVIECLGCTLKWSRGGFFLHHPKHGRMRTRVKSGCPEITDAGQAAAIIAELEMKRVAQLREKTQELQNQLRALRMMELRKADWRAGLADYVKSGDAAAGLQAIYSSPVFTGVPNHTRVSMAPQLDISSKAGWEHLKLLPLPRRMRKRLFKSSCWVLNMFAGDKRRDPVQALAGSTSSAFPGEAVVVNVDAMLSAGWNLQGDIYKALLWGAMTSRVKAVIASPPTGGLKPKESSVNKDLYEARHDKDVEMIAKTFFLFLASYAASGGVEPSLVCGAPQACEEMWALDMVQSFQQVVADIGVVCSEFDQGTLGHPEKAPMRLLHNLGLDFFDEEKDVRPDHLRPVRDPDFPPRRWCPGLRRAVYDGLRARGLGDGAEGNQHDESCELRKLTKEQEWRLHVLRDHVPFRRDCEQCVMMLGTGRPHRRVRQKSAYVLSVDVGGPLRVPSKDAHGSGYKYFLAAAYTKPKFEDQAPEEHKPEDLAEADYDFANLDFDPPPDKGEEGAEGGVVSSEEGPMAGVFDEEEVYEFSELDEAEDVAVKKVGDTRGLWDDDDFAAIEQEKHAKDTQGEEGNHAVPMDFLYYFKPLKGKSGKHVLKAIQEVVLQLRMENLPVARIHADRAHEMRSEALRQWTLDNNILLTRTEGQAPQSKRDSRTSCSFPKGKSEVPSEVSGSWCFNTGQRLWRRRPIDNEKKG